MIIAGAACALLIILTARRLHTSGGGDGLPAAIAAGGPTGLVLLARPAARTGRSVVVVTALWRSGLAGFMLASITVLVCCGVVTSTGNTAFATRIQPHVPDGIRGRVLSGSGLIWQSMRLASLLLGGLPTGTAGIRAARHLGGALLAAVRAGPILP